MTAGSRLYAVRRLRRYAGRGKTSRPRPRRLRADSPQRAGRARASARQVGPVISAGRALRELGEALGVVGVLVAGEAAERGLARRPGRRWRVFLPSRHSKRAPPARSAKPEAASRSRQASSPAPEVMGLPRNCSFGRRSKSTRRGPSPVGCSKGPSPTMPQAAGSQAGFRCSAPSECRPYGGSGSKLAIIAGIGSPWSAIRRSATMCPASASCDSPSCRGARWSIMTRLQTDTGHPDLPT